MVRVLDLRSIGCGLNSRPLHCRAVTLGKVAHTAPFIADQCVVAVNVGYNNRPNSLASAFISIQQISVNTFEKKNGRYNCCRISGKNKAHSMKLLLWIEYCLRTFCILLSSSDCERNFINSLQIQTVLAVEMFPLQLMK